MPVFSPPQIASIAYQAGFRGQALTNAVAVALAESGGNSDATHLNTDGSTDYGLWQINSIHRQFNPVYLTDPAYNARAAFSVSGGGSSWSPWVTYQTGAYLRYVPQAQGAAGVASGGTSGGAGSGSGGQKAWYTFPRIDNIGGVEPFGGFPKPDSNVQLPPGYPVTALLSGTVSGIDTASPWGATVTIRLDNPLNSLATHTAYLHLRGDIQVRVGQHVGAGQLIGYNGGSQAAGAQKVPLGFALYPGDNYGFGPAWSLMSRQNLLGPLNPVPILNKAAGGALPIPGIPLGYNTGAGAGGVAPTYIPLLEQVHETLINTPGFYGIALAVDEAEQFPGWIDLTAPQPPQDVAGLVSFQLPDIVGLARSIGASITDNFTPFAVRAAIVTVGAILLIALLIKPLGSGAGAAANSLIASGGVGGDAGGEIAMLAGGV